MAMSQLGNGLFAGKSLEDALSVYKAELSTLRRLGASEGNILIAQSNLANACANLGLHERAHQIERDVYSGHFKLRGLEHI